MAVGNLPMSPFILAFLLSSNLESYFRQGVSYAGGDYTVFFTRPVSLLFILIAVYSLVGPMIHRKIKKAKAA